MKIYHLYYRTLLIISGKDSEYFLENILSNDMTETNEKSLQYSLLLSPQGKLMYDFFVFKKSYDFYLDCHTEFLEEIISRLQSYKLHCNIEISKVQAKVFICSKMFGSNCFLDPHQLYHKPHPA